MANIVRQIIPARPGFDLVSPIWNENVCTELAFDPIICWFVTVEWHDPDGDLNPFTDPLPITPEGIRPEHWAIRYPYPENEIVFPGDRSFGKDQAAEVMRHFNSMRIRQKVMP